MSRSRALLAASIAVGILAACSGDDTNAPITSGDGGSDATTADTGGSSGAVDSAPPPDVSVPDTSSSGGGPIACGKVPTCDSKTQDCCLDTPSVCAPKGTCIGGSLSCSDTASCTTGICCAAVVRDDAGAGDAGDGGGGGGATVNATCASACKKGELQLCSTTADCTVVGDECRRGPGGLLGCRKPAPDAGADAGDSGIGDASDSG